LVTLRKNCWTRVLGTVVIQLYAGECMPSVDRVLGIPVTADDAEKAETARPFWLRQCPYKYTLSFSWRVTQCSWPLTRSARDKRNY